MDDRRMSKARMVGARYRGVLLVDTAGGKTKSESAEGIAVYTMVVVVVVVLVVVVMVVVLASRAKNQHPC